MLLLVRKTRTNNGVIYMIIMDLKVDNFYAFKKFHLNFSYPKKIVGNTLGEETLSGCPNFRYRRVNIVMGANATGKTSLGDLFNSIFFFIDEKNVTSLTSTIANTKKKAQFVIELIVREKILYRIDCRVAASREGKYTSDEVMVHVVSTSIGESDTYETCKNRLNALENDSFAEDYIHELEKVQGLSWCFEYPMDMDNTFEAPASEALFLKIANKVMRALDPSILAVDKLEALQDGYVIRTESKEIILKGGEPFNTKYLSSGTKAGVGVTSILTNMLMGGYGFFYCDEKFSYIDSEIEKAVLSIMIEKLPQDSQLFFTTHNIEILDMDLPKHTYMFLKKDSTKNNAISCILASDILKRNTDSLRRAVENDLLATLPSVDLIYELEEIEV